MKASAIPRKEIDRLCCAKCRFSTKDTDLFERHVSYHQEVTFSCALCSHVSYSKTESQKHVVSHTGSYPYRCSFCSYGAVRRDYMVKHILRIHKRNAEEGFISDFTVSTTDTGGPSVPDTLLISDWPERNDQCAIPNFHVEHPSGSQPSQSSVIDKTVSQTKSNRARMTYSFTSPCMTNTATVVPVSKTQFTGAVPICAPSASHSLGNTPQVVLRSREANGNLSNSQITDGNNKISVSEKLIPKATFPRVHVGSTEPLQQSPRVSVSEKAMAAKTFPRVQVRAPVELNTPLRALLSTPLSKRNIQMDQRSSQSTTGTNVGMQKPIVLPSGTIKRPLHSSAEKSNQSRMTFRAPVGSSAEPSSPLSSVQVELLAPLNQPIQHNKPLTVSCPEEINIPAGCLVELVEVKNVNGTRELELRLIPPNGTPQDRKSNVDEPSSPPTGGKLSFKCQVAKGCPVSPSTSSSSNKVKQQRPSMCTNVQTITKTVQSALKPQCSSETPAKKSKRQLKTKDPEIITLEGPELSSESLPVISSVFSLCPTPTSTQTISKSSPETQRWIVAMKEPKDELKCAEQSLVCSILIKKEDTEEKPKGASSGLKETKTEDETSKSSAISKTHGHVKTSKKTLNKQAPSLTQPLVLPNQSVVPSNKDDISHQDKGNSGQQHHSCVSNMYPKVALFRIPSSLLEPTKKLPEAPTREETLMARPVLCCTLSEQNVSGSPEVAIKLILKRNFCEREDKHQDSPPRKKHKKEKRKAKKRRSSSVVMGYPRLSTERHRELRLTPLKENQRVKLPGPNQPVVVLNHPNPSDQRVNVGVQTLKNYKWIRSVDHEQEEPARKQPSFKMKLKKVHGQKYQVIEFVLKGVSEKPLS